MASILVDRLSFWQLCGCVVAFSALGSPHSSGQSSSTGFAQVDEIDRHVEAVWKLSLIHI